MLSLKNVCKYYKYGKNKKVILDNINVSFNDTGMVFILGKSGSGKSTLLNIIAGNLRSDTGDVFIGNRKINELSTGELDNYRNSVVGYIYQDYNLIEYMKVIDNIKIGYTFENDKEKTDLLLKQLDIYGKKDMKVSKLSGGEKQRVAIARSLVNDPKIILADEPTGALDSENGIKIMEILKRISKNKLVIVVSHDKILADKYGDRIINLKDGKIINDSGKNVDTNEIVNDKIVIKKGKFRRKNIWKLSISHLWLKKGRSLMTMISISLGIVSMMLVLCIASNFNKELNDLERDVVSVFPISIKNGEYLEEVDNENNNTNMNKDKIYIKNDNKYINKISYEYIDYLKSLDIPLDIVYSYDKEIPLISDNYKLVDKKYLMGIPSNKYMEDNYEILFGKLPSNKFELLIKLDKDNMIDKDITNYFNLDDYISYDKMIGRKIRMIINDNYYKNNGDYFYIDNDYEKLYKDSEIELTIVGIVREKEENIGGSFIYYDDEIMKDILKINMNSEIVNNQRDNDYNVLGINISKDDMLSYLGGDDLPSQIDIYVDSIYDKELLIKKLDNYNKQYDKVIYEDTMANNIKIVKDFINIISVVLIIFSIVAIVISSLMIGILTSIRVLERKKEIGIIRSLGVSKRNIRKIFNIENMIIGGCSSFIGLGILMILREPINSILSEIVMIDSVLVIDYRVIFLVILFNIFIVRLAGLIPSRRASKLEITKCIYDR